MRIKICYAITDQGDGDHAILFGRSKNEIVAELGIDSEGFDEYGYYVQFEEDVIDTDNFEVLS